MQENPLLETFNTPFETPPFHLIENEHYLPAFQSALKEAQAEIQAIRENPEAPTFQNTLEALENAGEKLARVSSIFFNLNHAETNSELQKIAKEVSPLLSNHRNDILLDEVLFARIQKIYQQKEKLNLNPEQKMLLRKQYRAFVRNGANLDSEAKIKLREIDQDLSQLSLRFGDHVLAETNAYTLIIEQEEDLEGLPERIREMAAQSAEQKDLKGKWVFTLEYPSYLPFIQYAKKRHLRQEIYQAFVSRCFKENEYDNQAIVQKIVQRRQERAQLLGYESHAHFVLEERMAEKPEKVKGFLEDLLAKAKPAADREMEELKSFAKSLDGLEDFQAWDYAFYTEKLRKEKYAIDDETLKPYFQLDRVVKGIFEVANRLYGLRFEKNEELPKYHSDVQGFEVKDAQGKHISVFYADFFPRAGKKPGAWMTSYRGQKKMEGKEQRPIVSIVCNFSKPSASQPSLLTLQEVLTLFHEFGHALHGILADTQYESLSGTSVYWDFVELPSQIMENWAYEKETLDIFAHHYETEEAIPSSLVEKIKLSSNFMEGYQTLRQLGFGLLDMAWHSQDPSNISSVAELERQAMARTQLFPEVPGTNRSVSFAHIFQGGYSAGYYSYKWAEVLDADAFEVFKENGIFDRKTAEKFKEHILSKGGSESPMELYRRFRGQEPAPEALLKRSGLLNAS